MKCIDCPILKFDGNKFSCPAIPYHDYDDTGMFTVPQPQYGGICAYINVHLHTINDQLSQIEQSLKILYEDKQCYRTAFRCAPNVDRWMLELKERILTTKSKINELEHIKYSLQKEKTDIENYLKKVAEDA